MLKRGSNVEYNVFSLSLFQALIFADTYRPYDAYRVHVKRSESKKDFVRQIPNLLQYLEKRMERKASEMLLFSLKYTALL